MTMSPDEFVKGFYDSKSDMLRSCFDKNSSSMCSTLFQSMQLSSSQEAALKKAVDCLLTDTYYTILLGLEGEAAIGGWQHTFKILDEEGNEITGGEIEAKAYDFFHGEADS